MSDTKISEACERCGRCLDGDFANCKNARNLAEASRDALPFVAYAYSQGIEGAEEAGRAVESALEATPLHPQPAELAEQQGAEWNDSARLAYLESFAREPGGLLLHAESKTGRRGLGLGENCGNRTLAQAIDGCATHAEKGRFSALAATGKQQVGEVQGDDLLPCPFCGNNAEFVPYKNNGLTVKCKSMGCIQRHQRTLRYGIEWLRASMTEHWNARALAARQPGAQVPVASVEFINGHAAELVFTGAALPDGQHALYAAPPAQGLDMGQFRRPVEEWRAEMVGWVERNGDHSGAFSRDIAEADRLLALIDQRDSAPGVKP